MATASRRPSVRRRIRKAVKEQKQQRTIVRLSPKTREALKTKGVRAARRPR